MKRTTKARKTSDGSAVLDWGLTALCVIAGSLLVWFCCPYPATMTDSWGYLLAAIEKRFIVFRPYGYSAFLRVVHFFSHSVLAVFIAQALLYWLSLTLLLRVVRRTFPPRRTLPFVLLEALCALAPSALFMLDALMADTLYCSCLFLMLAGAVALLDGRSPGWLVLYAGAFFVALNTRYSAMFLPFAFVPVLLFVRKRAAAVCAVVLTLAVFLGFRASMLSNMQKAVGVRQFSTGFDGWQLANNAMHLLPHLSKEECRKIPADARLKQLHAFCLRRYDERILDYTGGGKRVVSAFVWKRDLPLKQYMEATMASGRASYQEVWVKLGSGLYADYGRWLILHYPFKFFRYYLWPNLAGVFYPRDTELVGNFVEIPAGKQEMVQWFDLPADRVMRERSPFFRRQVLPWLPALDLVTWLIFIVAVVVVLRRRRKDSAPVRQVLWLLFLLALVHYGSTWFATPVVLRYWIPMHAVKLIFAWIALAKR